MEKLSNIILYSIIPMLLVFDYLQRSFESIDTQWYIYFVSDKTVIFLLVGVIAITNKSKLISSLLLLLFAHELYQVAMDTTHNGVQLSEVYIVCFIAEAFIISYFIFKIQVNKFIKRWITKYL